MNSFHNHCNWSDGDTDMDSMYLAARNAGFREFGLSDHYVCAPFGDSELTDWSIDKSRLDQYVDACLACKKKYDTDTFTVRLGMEVDFFKENAKEVVDRLLQYPFDYLIGSIHFSGMFPVDHTAATWSTLSQEQVDNVWHDYWKCLREAAESGLYSFIGHLDLPKKFNFRPTYDYTEEAHAVIRAIKGAGIAMELNTAGWAKDCKSAYPAPNLVQYAHEQGVPILVSADAHHPDHVARFFPEAVECLRAAGYEQFTYSFEQMERQS